LVYGPQPPEFIAIEQDGLFHRIDIRNGHKTGYYLDQRKNRELVGRMAGGKDVLDCFSYSGGFSLQALKNGAAAVTLIDDSRPALDLASSLIKQNGFSNDNCDLVEGDVFKVLRTYRDMGRDFDLIILDPPKFAPTASHADRAARGYKDINLLAFKLLRPGGTLATFSCSGGISQEYFYRILSGAAKDAGVHARIQLHMGQSEDHSVNLSFPEGTYLKGFAIYVEREEV
jgi:23S rRNA (cytosine1962-C5)-methyltransferase